MAGQHKRTEKKLEAGQRAPAFKAVSVKGKAISLAHAGDKPLLLVFLRYAGCPWCNLTIHRLTLEYPLLAKQGCKVVAFIQSDSDSIRRNIYERHEIEPPFPIVADPDREIYKLYGVGRSVSALPKSIIKLPDWVHAVRHLGYRQTRIDGDFFQVPALFLVSGKTHKLIRCRYATSFYDDEAFISILDPLLFGDR